MNRLAQHFCFSPMLRSRPGCSPLYSGASYYYKRPDHWPTRGIPMRAIRSLSLMFAMPATLLLGGCSGSSSSAGSGPAGQVDGARIVAAENNAEWLSYGRTYSEQRFSPLTHIRRDNVKQLGLAW